MPGADKLVQIAAANNVTVDWMATGKGPGPEERADRVEQVLDAHNIESSLITVIESIEEGLGDKKLSPRQKARLVSVCSKVYLTMKPEDREKGFKKIVLAILDIVMEGRS